MDGEEREFLEKAFGVLERRMDTLDARIQEVHAEVVDLRGEMRGEVAKLGGEMHTIETRLLTEFWKWARPREIRMRAIEARLTDLDARIDALEHRTPPNGDEPTPKP